MSIYIDKSLLRLGSPLSGWWKAKSPPREDIAIPEKEKQRKKREKEGKKFSSRKVQMSVKREASDGEFPARSALGKHETLSLARLHCSAVQHQLTSPCHVISVWLELLWRFAGQLVVVLQAVNVTSSVVKIDFSL